ncbi:hypothetical protein BJ170DRAFT_684512 [Xylariales sp. AK1849]|nr:hypothetical protein BJ170DRAFT_684512 [Xylariales sp. AK1849]
MPISATPMTVAASASIVGSAAAAGAMAALSVCAIPAVLKAGAPSDVMLRQWYIIFNNGKAIPATAAVSAIGYGVVSYDQWTKGLQSWRGFALSGALAVAAIPFTMAFIMPTNNELMAAAHSAVKTMNDERVKSLIMKWLKLNSVRGFLPLAGAVVGLWSLLG